MNSNLYYCLVFNSGLENSITNVTLHHSAEEAEKKLREIILLPDYFNQLTEDNRKTLDVNPMENYFWAVQDAIRDSQLGWKVEIRLIRIPEKTISEPPEMKNLSMGQLADYCRDAVNQAMGGRYETLDYKYLTEYYMRWYEIVLLIINMQDQMLDRISKLQSDERKRSRLELCDRRQEITSKAAKVIESELT